MMLRRVLAALLLSGWITTGLAATVTHQVTTATTVTGPLTSGAFTPAANDLLGCFTQASQTVDAAPTLTNSNGITFTLIRQELYSSSTQSTYFFVANALANAVSQTVTFDTPADVNTGSVIACFGVAGLSRTGLDAIRQEGGSSNLTIATVPAPTFPAAALTGNGTLGAVANLSNPAAIIEPTGWTEAVDTGYLTPTSGLEYVFRNSGFTGTQITWGGAGATAKAAIIIELDTSAASSPPAFDVLPTVASQTTTAYTINYDADANAQNIFVAAYAKDTALQTCDAVELGTGAVATATEATTGAADSIVITIPGGDPFPLYDLQECLEGVGGDSAVNLNADKFLNAPAGRQRITKSGTPTPPQVGMLDGASPAAVDGDVMDASTLTDSFAQGIGAHALTVNVNTTFSIASGGDTSRQALTRRFYDVSIAAWSDVSPVVYYVNNQKPVYIGLDPGEPPIDPFLFRKDATLNQPLDDLWTDAEGDALTHGITNIPAGGTVTGSETLTGAFTTCGVFTTPSFRATDITADFTDQVQTITVGDLVPNVTNVAEVAAITTIQAVCSFTAVAGAPVPHQTIAVGNVVSTSPAIGVLVPFDQVVSYSLSSGLSIVSLPVETIIKPIVTQPTDPGTHNPPGT